MRRTKPKKNAKDLEVALLEMLQLVQWLQDSGNLKSPVEPHPFGLAVLMAKQNAKAALEGRPIFKPWTNKH